MQRVKSRLTLLFIFCVFSSLILVDSSSFEVFSPRCSGTGDEAIFWKYSGGVLGSPWSVGPKIWTFVPGGAENIALCTEKGLAVVDLYGHLNWSYSTTGPVLRALLVDDLDGDFNKDVVLIVDDQDHPNVIAISSHSYQELWFFTPSIQAIDSATFEKESLTTRSWDLICVGDVNADGIVDFCISSWYQIILLSGGDGKVLWSSALVFSNDVWELAFISNYDGNGNSLIIGGSEAGEIISIDLTTKVKHWSFQVDPFLTYYKENGQTKSIKVPNSIDDMQVISDRDNDGVADLLITSDDGIIRLFSGRSGNVLSYRRLFEVELNPLDDPLAQIPDSSPFTVSDRVFGRYGLRIEMVTDINGDGIDEYFLTARNLYSYQEICNEIYLISVSISAIEIIDSFHYNNIPSLLSYSLSCVLNETGDPIFYALSSSGIYGTATLYNTTSLAQIGDATIWSDSMSGTVSEDELASIGFLLVLNDTTGDSLNELFVATQKGTFGIFNPVTGHMKWSRTIRTRTTDALPISDLNGNGFPDIIFKHIGRSQIAWDPSIEKDVIIDFAVLDTENGSIIWRYKMPDFAIYDGLQDVKCVGDVTGDSIADFVAWIVPARVPALISVYFDNLGGFDELSLSESTKTYYRSRMANYSRLLLIDGRTGTTLWNPPINSMLYRFARSTSYSGFYENPTSQTPGTYKIANRPPRPPPAGWFSSVSTYLYTMTWARFWNITDLYSPETLEISRGSVIEGSVNSLGTTGENLTISAALDGSQWSAVFNVSIPTNTSAEKVLGAGEFPLSEQERLTALKFQTRVSLDATPISASLTYSLLNFTSGEWVLCNWTEGNKIWDGRYADLHGDYNSSGAENGFRSSYSNFAFSRNTLVPDIMYVVARGTADADAAVEFDYENVSTLSAFMNSSGTIKIQINVTDTQAFQASFNTFGIVPFAWGVAPPHFDSMYMYDLLENAGVSSVQDDYLLELDIQALDIINGTGDSYLDVVAITGPEFMEYYPTTIGSRLILFDLCNRVIYNRWGTNRSIFPTDFVRLLPLNDSLNSFLLSGRFKNSTGSYGTAHVYMKDPHWDHSISQFGNYSLIYATMDFNWIYSNYSFRYSRSGLGKVILNSAGDLGLIAGGYKPGPELENLTILDLNTLSPLYDISTRGLYGWSTDAGSNFALPGIGYVLQLGDYDFNNDGWYDHVGLYRPISGFDSTSNNFVIYSGNPVDKGVNRIIANSTLSTSLVGYNPSDFELTFPFAVPGDMNNDGILDFCVGIDAKQAVCTGAKISNFYIGTSTISDWVLEPIKCSTGFEAYDLVDSFTPTEDFTCDGHLEFLLNRNQFLARGGEQAVKPTYVSEILDLFERRIVFRFTLPSREFFSMPDINGDSINDFSILTENSLICINSRFGANFTNIVQDQLMPTASFTVEWSASVEDTRFELRVDGISYVYTYNDTLDVSLGPGNHDIQLLMYDESNIVIAMDSVNVTVPPEYTLAIWVGVVLVAIICIYVFWQRRYNKAWNSAQKIIGQRRKSNGRFLTI